MTLGDPHGASTRFAAAMLFLALSGCASAPSGFAVATPEIRPGVAAGYLAAVDIPDSAMLLPSPPATGSQAFAADLEASELRKQHGSPRWQQAKRDAVLSFPEAAGIFECALDVPVTESGTPHLYRLLRRSRRRSRTNAGRPTRRSTSGVRAPRFRCRCCRICSAWPARPA